MGSGVILVFGVSSTTDVGHSDVFLFCEFRIRAPAVFSSAGPRWVTSQPFSTFSTTFSTYLPREL